VGAAGFSGAGGGYGGVVAGPAGGYAGGVHGPAGNGMACGVGPGEECTACGVACGGGAGGGALSYVGSGQGSYVQETTYQYVGHGGDFGRPRRDFTCIICLSSLLLLIPLLCWLLSGSSSSLPFDCEAGFGSAAIIENSWSQAQKDYCCMTVGRGCATTALPETTITVPPTPFPTPPPTPPATRPATLPTTRPPAPPTAAPGPVDPYNCAVGTYFGWDQAKQTWCCNHHHICGQPTEPPRPADPYNCQDGFANWQAGWSVAKKEWCCRVHGKGCPNQGGGCVTSSEPYDCDAGFANWMAGWSVPKKAWCCANKGKGCPPAAGGCA